MDHTTEATTSAHPTAVLWGAFDPDVRQSSRMAMFCGVPYQLVDDVLLMGTARSRPAARLVSRTPAIMRQLAHQTTMRTERCVGHVRGPIMWGETITAWSSGVGVDDVFICGTPQRDFDVPENRLLVWVLKRLVAAGRRIDGDGAAWFAPEEVERIRVQGRAAQKLLEHRNLRTIPVRKLNGRELRLVRKSRHLDTYGPAIKLAERAVRPFAPTDVQSLVRETTVEDHRVVQLILDAVRARGHAVPLLTVRGDFVVAGQLRYRNPSVMVDRRLSAESGMFFGDQQVLTRADAERPGETRTDGFREAQRAGRMRLVETRADAEALVSEVIGTAASPAAGATAQSASGFVQLPGSYSS